MKKAILISGMILLLQSLNAQTNPQKHTTPATATRTRVNNGAEKSPSPGPADKMKSKNSQGDQFGGSGVNTSRPAEKMKEGKTRPDSTNPK